MNDEHVHEKQALQILRSLAEHDGGCEASPDLEARLRREFRRHQTKRARRRRALWAGTTTVAASLIIVAVLVPRRVPIVVPQAAPQATTSSKNERPLRAAHAVSSSTARRATKLVSSIVQPSTKASPAKAARAPKAQTAETVTDFFPLLYPAPPFERGEILRVNLPASVMRTVGLPVREEHLGDRVQADILVGEEGLPRAIRFVRTDMQ